MKMDKALKTLWVDALRSGEYKQTRGALKKGSSFCCLGVLCDLVVPFSTKIQNWIGDSPTIWEKMGIPEKTAMDLVDMNDEDKKSFPEIADYIEKRL